MTPVPGAGALLPPESVRRRVLANGLTVLARRDVTAPVVAIVTWVKAGYFDEPDDTVGIASLKPARNAHGRLQLQRAYDFEFSDTGDNRVKGSIVMLGRRVLLLNIKPRSAAEVFTLH